MKEPWTQKVERWLLMLRTTWRCRLFGHRWQPNTADASYEWCPQCRGGRMTTVAEGER